MTADEAERSAILERRRQFMAEETLAAAKATDIFTG